MSCIPLWLGWVLYWLFAFKAFSYGGIIHHLIVHCFVVSAHTGHVECIWIIIIIIPLRQRTERSESVNKQIAQAFPITDYNFNKIHKGEAYDGTLLVV